MLTCCKLKGDRAHSVLTQDTAPAKAKSKACCDFMYMNDSVPASETNIMKRQGREYKGCVIAKS